MYILYFFAVDTNAAALYHFAGIAFAGEYFCFGQKSNDINATLHLRQFIIEFRYAGHPFQVGQAQRFCRRILLLEQFLGGFYRF